MLGYGAKITVNGQAMNSQSYTFASLQESMKKMQAACATPEPLVYLALGTKVGLDELIKRHSIPNGATIDNPAFFQSTLSGIPFRQFNTETGAEFHAELMRQEGRRVLLIRDSGEVVDLKPTPRPLFE